MGEGRREGEKKQRGGEGINVASFLQYWNGGQPQARQASGLPLSHTPTQTNVLTGFILPRMIDTSSFASSLTILQTVLYH